MEWMESGGKNFDIEPGIYNAVCTELIDLGTQEDTYEGHTRERKRCIIAWELVDEIYEKDGEPRRKRFSQVYTQSLHAKATLRKHLSGWRGRDFTAEELKGFKSSNILGKPCVLVVGLSEKGKPVVESVSKYKGTPVEANGELHEFNFAGFDGKFQKWMSDGLCAWCSKSKEYSAWMQSQAGEEQDSHGAEHDDIGDEEIPF
jgi:hypothetical protein